MIDAISPKALMLTAKKWKTLIFGTKCVGYTQIKKQN
jgi:hypothetical protein